MLGWLCLLGWVLFASVVVFALGFMNDMSCCGPYTSVHDSPTNWKTVKIVVIALWIFSIVLKVAIWGWW